MWVRQGGQHGKNTRFCRGFAVHLLIFLGSPGVLGLIAQLHQVVTTTVLALLSIAELASGGGADVARASLRLKHELVFLD